MNFIDFLLESNKEAKSIKYDYKGNNLTLCFNMQCLVYHYNFMSHLTCYHACINATTHLE